MSMSYRISGFLITISIAVIGWLIWPPLAALWSIQRTTDVVRRFLSRRAWLWYSPLLIAFGIFWGIAMAIGVSLALRSSHRHGF
jgi:hypothetical protein